MLTALWAVRCECSASSSLDRQLFAVCSRDIAAAQPQTACSRSFLVPYQNAVAYVVVDSILLTMLPPHTTQVQQMGQYFGIKQDEDKYIWEVAEMGLCAPLPPSWKEEVVQQPGEPTPSLAFRCGFV